MAWTDPGTRVRFHSYLGAEYILGVGVGPQNRLVTQLKHLSVDNNSETTFIVAPGEAQNCFKLTWGRDPTMYLVSEFVPRRQLWLTNQDNLVNYHGWNPSSAVSHFAIDPVKDGRWFALNNQYKTTVVDLAAGLTAHNTPIYFWPWNSGDNQVWRAEVV